MQKFNRAAAAGMLAATVCAGISTAAQAQEAGTWSARVTGVRMEPRATSAATVGVTYMVTDHIAIDYPITPTFKYSLAGGSELARLGKLGDARVLPLTVFAQYRFGEPHAAFRPYVGVGATYARFDQEQLSASANRWTGGTAARPTTLRVDNQFTLTPQIGFVYQFKAHWFVDVSYARSRVRTTAHLSSGQSVDLTFKPDVFLVGVGYRF